ncbi:MAG: right-handed parallel beta-helix repeat-containing protein [Oligoflexia bacterium]|nr:right-handed parallel beta-helix repeat-containing protein [Oligoflexia bacterium]
MFAFEKNPFSSSLRSLQAAVACLALGASVLTLTLTLTGCSFQLLREQAQLQPVQLGEVSHLAYWPSTTTAPPLSWSFTGSPQLLDRYEYALGTAPGLTDVRGWTSSGKLPEAAPSGLSLSLGQSYFATVRAVGTSGELSAARNSAGWLVVNEASIQARYPAAPNWNDYVRAADTAATCPSNEQGVWACIHGGEKKQASYPGPASCAGYTAADALGAFDWDCTAGGGALTFRSRGLKENRGVGHLVTETGWKPNQLIVYQGGTAIAATTGASWWNNPVLPLPDNSSSAQVALTTPGAVYVLGASRASGGYAIAADRIALTMLPGAELRFFDAGASNCISVGLADGRCLIDFPDTRAFVWIEGTFRAIGAFAAVNSGFVYHGRFRLISASGASWGMVARALNSTLVERVTISDNASAGLYVDGSNLSELASLDLRRNETGIRLGDLNNRLLLRQSWIVDNSNSGFDFAQSDVVMSGVTVLRNGLISLEGISSKLTANNLLSDNQIYTVSGDLPTFSQSVVERLQLHVSNSGKFTGLLLFMGAGACAANANTGIDSSCNLTGASDATKILGLPTDLAALAGELRNRTGNGVTDNDPFVPGATCPAAAHGNVASVDLYTTPRTFLRNAIELQGDERGNDNGLCETGEACLYTPNFGAYQGEGDYLGNGPCLFQNGTVSGVTLYAYPTNSAPLF